MDTTPLASGVDPASDRDATRSLLDSIMESYIWCGMTAVDDMWCECGYCQQGTADPYDIEHKTDCRCLQEMMTVGGIDGTE